MTCYHGCLQAVFSAGSKLAIRALNKHKVGSWAARGSTRSVLPKPGCSLGQPSRV